ncbi:MAG: excinuclease [Candidatus Brocadiaceae bacterium]|nr:excinuclease [Candidatus Brocadiaceae bacterium]
MKGLIILLLLSLLLVPSSVYARNDIGSHSIKEALALERSKEKLGNDNKFFFGDQAHGKILENHGEFRTNKKTNAFNKSDLNACQWAFLSAMITLRDRALREGGNAIINIKSNYKNNLTSSEDTFQCGAGAFVAGVALVGTVVTLAE